MDSLFNKLRKFEFSYVDDLIVYSKSNEEHLQHLDQVFNILKVNGLKVNLEKSNFMRKDVEYLGYVVNNKVIKSIEEKIKAIIELKPPRTIKQLRSFLSTMQFYCKFIKN